jgi:hypothetical protein
MNWHFRKLAIGEKTRDPIQDEFFDQENFNGRPVLVRFIVSDIKTESCKFEQSFSTDGGKTWEVNWIAIDTRVKE